MQLKQKYQEATIKLNSKTRLLENSLVQATLTWNTEVDLDLEAYYAPKKAASGFFRVLGRYVLSLLECLALIKCSGLPGEGLVSHSNKGSRTCFPFISLGEDAGVDDVGGEKEENLFITDMSNLAHILIVVNIFEKPHANFAKYGGKVTVRCGSQVIEVPLTSSEQGSYCIVAHIDNTGSQPVVKNINEVLQDYPTIAEFLQSRGK